ncbi:MAG TPA: Nramp family divalent metal transporter [Chloroflexota bacterium]|nr:Nramp family divalent metal transporter [Chloroflexota bacterium]
MELKQGTNTSVWWTISHPGVAIRSRLGASRLKRLPIWPYLAILGPGLVAANAGNDAGGIATYAQAGSGFGYNFLWMMVVVTVSLILVQEMCARMGAITGKGLSELIREQFGPRWTVFAMITLLIANGLTTMSEFAGIAASLELVGVSRYVSVPLSALLIWWLVARGTYSRVERVFLLMTLAFFAYPISAILAHPDWGEVARETVIPTIQLNQVFMFQMIATIGTTITPYMQIFVQSSVVDKGITANDYKYERGEVIFGSIFSNVIAIFIIITTAATLYVNHITIVDASSAALALEPLAGHYAFLLFGVGLLGASMLAAGVLPLATAFSITEAFGWEKGLSFQPSEAPAFYYLFTSLIAIGALVTLIPGLPLFQLLIVVQVVNCMLLPALLVFIVKLASTRSVMGSYRNSRTYNIFAWGTVIVIGSLASIYLVILVVGPLVGFGANS